MGLILCLFLIMSISAKDTTYVKPNPLAYTGYIFNSALFGVNTNPLQEPNYLGLAQMGLIPSKIQCSHTKESYISTDVVVTNKQDNKNKSVGVLPNGFS